MAKPPDVIPLDQVDQSKIKAMPDVIPLNSIDQSRLKSVPDVIPLSSIDQSKLKAIPDVIPLDQIDESKLTKVDEQPSMWDKFKKFENTEISAQLQTRSMLNYASEKVGIDPEKSLGNIDTNQIPSIGEMVFPPIFVLHKALQASNLMKKDQPNNIPISTGEVSKFLTPSTPLEIQVWVVLEALGPLSKAVGGKAAELAANRIGRSMEAGLKGAEGIEAAVFESGEKIVPMTAKEVSEDMAEIKRASEGPDPIVKPTYVPNNPKQTILNIAQDESRPKLLSEQRLLGLKENNAELKKVFGDISESMIDGKNIPIVKGQTLAQAAYAAVERGVIEEPQFLKWFTGYSVTNKEEALALIKQLGDTGSEYGRGLAEHAKFKRRLVSVLDPKALEEMSKWDLDKYTSIHGFLNAWDSMNDVLRGPIDIRKRILTISADLQMRDVRSHGSNSLYNVIENGISGSLAQMSGKNYEKDKFGMMKRNWASLTSIFNKGAYDEMLSYLKKFPVQAARLNGSMMGELVNGQEKETDGKIVKGARGAYNFINFVHKWSFDAVGTEATHAFAINRAELKYSLLNPEQLKIFEDSGAKKWHLLTEGDWKEAIDHGQRTIMTKMPEWEPARTWVLVNQRNPVLSLLGQTFPKMSMNLLENVIQRSPVQFFNKNTYKMMNHPDPQVAYKKISMAISGTTMMSMGMAAGFMHKPGSGGNWYDIDIFGIKLDGRKWAPAASNFIPGMLIGQALRIKYANRNTKPEDQLISTMQPFLKMRREDWESMLFSFKTKDIGSLNIINAINYYQDTDRGRKRFKDNLIHYVADITSAAALPSIQSSVKEFAGIFDKEERQMNFVRDRPFMGPFIQHIPFYNKVARMTGLFESLEPIYGPLSGKPLELNSPLLRLFGIPITENTPVEVEANRLGMTWEDKYPRTGIPHLDNVIAKLAGPYIESEMTSLMKSKEYLLSKEADKLAMFKEIIKRNDRDMADVAKDKLTPEELLESMSKRWKSEGYGSRDEMEKELKPKP